ncbi:MAG: sulfatase/phosphatase domain-containing protein, partial [Pseudomonadota bacterium]
DSVGGCARLEGPVETHVAFFLTSAAGACLEDVGEDPFFLRVDPWGPHPPYIVGGPYEGSVDPDSVALPENFDTKLSNRPQHHADYSAYWANTLSLTDREWRLMAARAQEHTMLVEAAMVQILETLDVLDLTDRTLVIFCADHGDAVASNGRVSNKGGLMVEETMRVPLLVAGPGLGTASVDERLATNMDLPATILDYCGVSSDQNLHGRSLLGSRADGRGALMTQHYGLHERLIQRALYQQNWKYVIQESGFEELYDLETDPFELDNLSHASSSRQLLQQMRRDLLSEMNRTGDGEPAILSHLASATSS